MKKIFTSGYKKTCLLTIAALTVFVVQAQDQKQEEKFLQRIEKDTTSKMNMDAMYNRPFLKAGKLPIAVGGYAEANSNYVSEDGVTEGLSFQFKRLTLFFSSSLGRNIKFFTELEFEDGTKEINIEAAALDFTFHPSFNFRGGIIVNPIGAFNQNHDGPLWEFIDRPLMATQLLPATFSNAGFGVYGKIPVQKWSIGYEAYLSNGFNDKIIDNDNSRTYLLATKQDVERFEENVSGLPMFTGKLALKHSKFGEYGFSYMGGVYNSWRKDGVEVAPKRSVNVYAVDANWKIKSTGTKIIGEFAWVGVDVPENYIQQFGNKQQGGFIDIVQPVYKKKILNWENATFNVAIRAEYVDWNVGTLNEVGGEFKDTGINLGDHVMALVPGVSFRPNGQTVIRMNYRIEKSQDLLLNPYAKKGAWQFGLATYF